MNNLKLEITTLNDITILPTIFFEPIGFKSGDTAFGAFRSDGTFADELELNHLKQRTRRILQCPNEAEYINTTAIYGGIYIDHFGHFIVDTLTRSWAWEELPQDIPIIWNHWRNYDPVVFKPFQLEYFESREIDTNRFYFINNPIKVKTLLVPSPGFVRDTFGNDEHFKKISYRTNTKKVKDKKVWLSRSKYEKNRLPINYTNMEEAESILKENGWEIVYPELLTLNEQVELLSTSKYVAGLEGSAFHTLALIDTFPDIVIIFDKFITSCCKSFNTIARLKKFNQIEERLTFNFVTIKDGVKFCELEDPYQPLNIITRLIQNK